MTHLNIIIADDHPLFIEGIKKVLMETDKFSCNIIGEAENGRILIRMLRKIEADLLLLDMNLPDMDGLEILSQIKERKNGMRVIILTMYDETKIIKSAFKAGVDGYILKGGGMKELFQAIEKVMDGDTYLGEGVALTGGYGNSTLTKGRIRVSYEDRFVKKYHLTKREVEVLKLISQALSNKEIAKNLFISDQTVSVHRKNIMRKLNVSNTAGLIKVAYDNSLI